MCSLRKTTEDQTLKRGPTYYREDSHLRGYRDCADISQCVRAELIDAQVGELVQSLKLPVNWEELSSSFMPTDNEMALIRRLSVKISAIRSG